MQPNRPESVPANARWNSIDARWEESKLEDGTPVGPFRAWTEAGALLFEGRFAQGRLQGEFKRFAGGALAREGSYQNGNANGEVTAHRAFGDGFVWIDERARRALLTYDDDGDVTSRLELDERGREVAPGLVLDPRAGTLDALFAEHGPDRFLASGAFAKAVAALAPPKVKPTTGDGLLFPYAALATRPLSGARFQELYGVPMPEELATWLEAVKDSPQISKFQTTPDLDVVATGNLVEAAICELQAAPGRATFFYALGSSSLRLGKAFTIDLALGLYEPVNKIPNGVYPLDTTDQTIGAPIARSLDDFAYLVTLLAADECGAISRSALTPAYEKLRGRIELPGGFDDFEGRALPGGSGGEIEGDTSTDHREGFALRRAQSMPRGHHYRGRWLAALLRGNVEQAYELFLPPWDAPMDKTSGAEFATLLDGIKNRTSTGIYGLFRAWIFQRPELDKILEAAKTSPSLVVRDAAALVAELAAGRKTLGAVDDMEAVRAAFVAMKPWDKKEENDEESDEDEDEESDEDEDDDE